ncbi:MAG TPA: pitrilysin family protein [Thermodesulfobacteriota bacterium]|nr:pitrilysin family protein [Thermodesulfobacteriota bacterium]
MRYFILIAGIMMFIHILEGKGMTDDRTRSGEEFADFTQNHTGVTKFKLDNGLTVLLEENHSAPVVAVNVWVKVGSACEEDGEYGIAHVHEHMVFKGTEKRGVGEIARIIEGDGGDINAFTSFDETVYYVVIAGRFLDTALDVLSDAMENSSFDAEELQKELQVVLEEIRRGEDSPQRNLSERLFSEAYTAHPYRRPVIGSKESVSGFTREKIVNFYKKWYSPNNMVLVVVGDFDTRKVVPKIKETFGTLKPRTLPNCHIPEEPVQKEMRAVVFDKKVQEGYFSLAFHTTDARNDDTPVLDVISNILGGGDSSRLYRRVKEDKGLVSNIYSYSFTPKYPGLFAVGGTLDPDKASSAFSEIIKETYLLKYEPVSYEELSRAKVNIESNSIYTKETMQGQAQKLGYYEVEAGDYKYEDEYLKKVSLVTQEDIMRVARKYFRNSNLTTAFLLPTGQVTIEEKEIIDIANRSAQALEKELSLLSIKSSGDVKKAMLDNGITVLIKQNHSVPLFAARAAFLGGVRFEDEKDNGVSNFLSEMFTRGTKNRSAEDIAREIESIAGEVSGFSGRNSFGVTVESLSRNFDQAIDIFADVIMNPSFDPEEIERARRDILSAINRQGDNLLRTTINLFLSTLYRENPYRFDVLGTKETITNMTRDDLINFYQKYVRPENMVISVVGNVDENRVLSMLESYFGEMGKGRFSPPQVQPESPPSRIRTAEVEQKDKAQTHIILGFLAPTLKDPDQYPFEVLNAILSGQGGRLFLELRDKRSLAYTVTSFFTPGLEPGFFGVYIGCAPEKQEEAIQGIKEQLALVLEKGVTDEELKRAQNYLVGNFEIGLQQNSAQAAKIAFDELYGLGWDEYKRYPEEIYSVTKDDIQRVARKYIHLDKYTLAIVKPEGSS